MNLQEIAHKHKVSENFLNSRDDAFDIAAASLEDLIFELKKGTIEQETMVYKLQQLRNFLVDVRSSTF